MASRRGQRGQGSLEYLAVLAVAAAVVSLILAVQPGLRRWASGTVSAITNRLTPVPAPIPAAARPQVAPPAPRRGGGGGGLGGLIRVVADVAGFIPGAGDLVDAGVCLYEVARGNFGDAALSCASAIPVAGAGANAIRVGRRAEGVIDAARAACRSNSFLPDTPVLLADGSRRAIADVAVGDMVLATDPVTGTTGSRRVSDIIVGRGLKDLVSVSTGGGTTTATAYHPFFVGGGRGWVDATDLRPGDPLRTPDGHSVTVRAVVRFRAWRSVHNLTVDGLHTYYAGDTPVLVHNCHQAGRVLTNAQRAANRQAREAALRAFRSQYFRFGNETFLLDKRGMDHILARHHPRYWDGSTKAGQTFFDESTSVDDIRDMVGEVLRQNREVLVANGSNGPNQVTGRIGGVAYRLGLTDGRVGQFFPLPPPPS